MSRCGTQDNAQGTIPPLSYATVPASEKKKKDKLPFGGYMEQLHLPRMRYKKGVSLPSTITTLKGKRDLYRTVELGCWHDMKMKL